MSTDASRGPRSRGLVLPVVLLLLVAGAISVLPVLRAAPTPEAGPTFEAERVGPASEQGFRPLS